MEADLPGVKPSDVDVRLDGDMLTISGEKRMESERKEEDYQVMERSYGRFRRSIQLPFAPDPEQVRAECQDGVLTVRDGGGYSLEYVDGRRKRRSETASQAMIANKKTIGR